MRAVLEFDLPDDYDEYRWAREGGAYLGTLGKMREWLRGQIKYGDPGEERRRALQDAADKLVELAGDCGVLDAL